MKNVIRRYRDKLLSELTTLSDAQMKTVIKVLAVDDELNSPLASGLDRADESPKVEQYAENLYNFDYNYKPEAEQIDPRIDHTESHTGPMAQDIEQVAPDCVEETTSGAKVVDGNRLALVNAGVIGELSRRVLDLEARVGGANGR